MTILDAFDDWKSRNPAIDQSNHDSVVDFRAREACAARFRKSLLGDQPEAAKRPSLPEGEERKENA